MSDPHAASLPPHAQLVQMGTAHWMSHVLYVAAKLNLADHLAKGRAGIDDLAAVTKTHSASLGRFLRTLGHLGLVAEDGAGRFTLTPLGEAHRTVLSLCDGSVPLAAIEQTVLERHAGILGTAVDAAAFVHGVVNANCR